MFHTDTYFLFVLYLICSLSFSCFETTLNIFLMCFLKKSWWHSYLKAQLIVVSKVLGQFYCPFDKMEGESGNAEVYGQARGSTWEET